KKAARLVLQVDGVHGWPSPARFTARSPRCPPVRPLSVGPQYTSNCPALGQDTVGRNSLSCWESTSFSQSGSFGLYPLASSGPCRRTFPPSPRSPHPHG